MQPFEIMREPENRQLQDQLTDREVEILNLIAQGLTNQEIAKKLFLSLETIRWYTKRIYSKMYVSNRTQAAALAREMGLLSDNLTPDSVPKLPKSNLPAQVTAFVGRDKEIKDLSGLLRHKSKRLITILAPGGMGKTRLAVQVAKATLMNFPDGVFFISLEHLDSNEQIITAITEILNIQLSTSRQLEGQLLDYLHDKDMLLVIDGFEKLISENALISNMLVSAPGLKILVTSRERLNLNGENIYTLKGLEITESEVYEQVLKSSAVKLFIQSAKLVQPNFFVLEDDIPSLVRICRLVEGMPLGILLAAAWVEALSLEEISNEIVKNLDFLKTEKQDVPQRQRSIQAVFDYSLGLLPESERPIFKKLSVFQGSFTREAALEVAGAQVKHLARFVEKSLLQYDPLEKRYKLHELLRQYAVQMLDQDQLLNETYNAHENYFADFLMQMGDGVTSADQLDALDQIQADLENVRFAWNWAIKQDKFEFIDNSLESLYWFCVLRGRVPDGEELFQKARNQFSRGSEAEVEPRRRRLLLRFDASGEDYKTQLEHALSLSRKDAEKSEVAFLLWAYGVNGYVMQEFNRAISALEESLLLYQELNDLFYSVEILHLLWICNRFLGNTDEADVYYKQALEISRKAGNKIAVARALGAAGAFQFMSGDYTNAEISTQEALDLRREIKDGAGEAMSLAMLSWLLSIRGNLERAKSLAESSLKIAVEVNSINSKMTSMNVLGWIACLENDFEYAIQLGLDSHTRAPDPTVVEAAELVLSFAMCGIEDYQVSRKYLRSVLEFGLSIGGYGLMFLSLPIISLYLANVGETEIAAETIALSLSFPSSMTGWMKSGSLISKLHSELKPELEKNEFQLKWEGGKMQALGKAIQDTLHYLD